MLKIPFVTWIANAAAALTGAYGDVTRQAEVADWSRQTIYDHAHKVQAALEDAHDGGPTRAEVIEQNQWLFRSKVRGRGFSWHLAMLHSGVIIPIWPQENSGAAS
jgi:hypothetical protein